MPPPEPGTEDPSTVGQGGVPGRPTGSSVGVEADPPGNGVEADRPLHGGGTGTPPARPMLLRWLRLGTLAVAWGVVAGLGMAFALRFVGSSAHPRVVYLLAVLPWMGLALGFPLVVAVVARRRELAGVTVVLCVLWAALYVPQYDSGPNAVNPDWPTIRVVTINAYAGNPHTDEFVALLEDLDADLIAIQELSAPQWEAIESSSLADTHPWAVADPRPDAFGVGLLSRLRTDDLEIFTLDTLLVAAGTVTTSGAALQVLNVHVRSPSLPMVPRWRHELEGLGLHASELERPLLVGDLNATTDHPELRGLLDVAGLRDAHALAGRGWGGTWPSPERSSLRDPWPFSFQVRIDHVFVPADVDPISVRTVRVPGSDHRAVVADLAVDPMPGA